MVAYERGADFVFESPVARGEGSRFAIDGKKEHVDMLSHDSLRKLTQLPGVDLLYFDQCVFGATSAKTTQLLATADVRATLQPLVGERFCSHAPGTHSSIVGVPLVDGGYRTRQAQTFPPALNAQLAVAFAALVPPVAPSVPHAGGKARAEPIEACCVWSDVAPSVEAMAVKQHTSNDPSWNQAMQSDEKEKWRDAAKVEIDNFDRHGVKTEVSEDSLPTWNVHKGRASEVIDMLWVLKKKFSETGELVKYKARAVVCGNQQTAKTHNSSSESVLETFAPAARSTTFKLLCAVCCLEGRRVRQFDVEAAYLQGEFDGDDAKVHVRPPPGEQSYDTRGVPIVWLLLKPLYGEVDAGRIWHRTAKKQLVEEQKFSQSEHDPCLFFKVYPDGSRADLVLYVDDCWFTNTSGVGADDDLKRFSGKFKLTVESNPKQFLGMNVTVHDPHHISLSAEAYVKAKAEQYLRSPVEALPVCDTPAAVTLIKDYEKAMLKQSAPDYRFMKAYQSKVGALIYAVPCGRPGEAFAIGVLARALTFPTPQMNSHADRVLTYMAKSSTDALHFNNTAPDADVLVAFSDSDWAVGHSTTGFCVMFGGAAISYGSKRQHCIALSSTEAEIIAASHVAAEIVHLRGLLHEMGRPPTAPTVLYVDNSGAVELAKERRSCRRSRHVDRRDLKVREYVAQGVVLVKKIHTDDNPADVLTKALPREIHQRHVRFLTGKV
eukprot:2266682-Pleurochrysis_carterae.AAC.1